MTAFENVKRRAGTPSTTPAADPEGQSAFMRLLGDALGSDARGSRGWLVEVGADHHLPWGLVHGGIFTAVIETFATAGPKRPSRTAGSSRSGSPTHRRSHAEPGPLAPGVVEPVEPELHATFWVFPAGHRLRLALAGSDWPNAVPPPAPVTLTVERDGSVLTLPVLPAADPSPPPPPRAGQAAGAEEAAPHPAPDATSSPDTAAAFTAGSAQPRTPGHRCAAPDPPEPAGSVAAGT